MAPSARATIESFCSALLQLTLTLTHGEHDGLPQQDFALHRVEKMGLASAVILGHEKKALTSLYGNKSVQRRGSRSWVGFPDPLLWESETQHLLKGASWWPQLNIARIAAGCVGMRTPEGRYSICLK
ncbi:hypothetical protein VFPPC_18684 [Pochonia chlamydosporia 170]|uniref:Uncharacterized protein n=1 Tax=Pochonia chlamydosporia 170 TaxID=1380566 RepID=A0A219ASM4_METCM|nr:hypothetical protein VFPPC_18684 [Pochonia chlamydosporia 170]OWT43589.1 hypothetical protein VFPPC_18684 [Pochonia chlamydosporia 170]